MVSVTLFGDTRCGRSWSVEEPGSGYHRLYHIYDGACTMHTEKADVQLSHGLYLLPAWRPYRLSHDIKFPLTCRWFHFTAFPPVMSGLVRIPVTGAVASIVKALSLVMKHAADDAVAPLIDALVAVLRADGKLDGVADERLARVFGHIDADVVDCSNERLASIAGLNREYFIRLFEKSMSMTPQEYIARCRIERAKKAILGGARVSAAAAAVGFSDDKAFSRFFKARTGVPPASYRSHSRQP